MPQIGPMEIMVVGIIALIAFGPKRLPEMARTVAHFLTELRRQAADVRSEFEAGMRLEDEPSENVERPRVHKETTNPARADSPDPAPHEPSTETGESSRD